MSFARSQVRRPSGPRSGAVVHAVGQRVYVASSPGGSARVELTDEGGTTTVGTLVDGTEVMVVAWRPRGSTGTRYSVRSTTEGLEGWLAAINLRSTRVAAPAPAAAAAAPPGKVVAAPIPPRGTDATDSKARFGRR
jgi:hypothetical protein